MKKISFSKFSNSYMLFMRFRDNKSVFLGTLDYFKHLKILTLYYLRDFYLRIPYLHIICIGQIYPSCLSTPSLPLSPLIMSFLSHLMCSAFKPTNVVLLNILLNVVYMCKGIGLCQSSLWRTTFLNKTTPSLLHQPSVSSL